MLTITYLLILTTVLFTTSNQGNTIEKTPAPGIPNWDKMCVRFTWTYGNHWSNMTNIQKKVWCFDFTLVDRATQMKEENCSLNDLTRKNIEEAYQMCSWQRGVLRRMLDYKPISQHIIDDDFCKKIESNLKVWDSDGDAKKRTDTCTTFTTSSDQMGVEVNCKLTSADKDLIDKAVKDCPDQAVVLGKIKGNAGSGGNMISVSLLPILLSVIVGYIYNNLLQKIEL